jgi:hypothetical protein
MKGAIGSRQFTLTDQLRFAELSGDRNPMHINSVAARRTMYGDVVVHGVHSLLWALECYAEGLETPVRILKLKTEFRKQISLADMVQCEVIASEEGSFTLALSVPNGVATTIECVISEHNGAEPDVAMEREDRTCVDRTFEEISVAAGSLALYLDPKAFVSDFPNLARKLSSIQIAEILATTRLVGMECPGLHSVYSAHDLHYHENASTSSLSYRTVKVDSRFSMLRMDVAGPTLSGTITAFARPRPAIQPSLSDVARVVQPTEFRGERALVIGGSRGLGELTAKIIAAGGGDVRISYYRGSEDAERLASEIRGSGGKCECIRFDAGNPDDQSLRTLRAEWKPTQLYYFATPLISLERRTGFSASQFLKYCEFYVSGFAAAVEAVLPIEGQRLAVFYPSTVFLSQYQKNSTEYCAAKAAGEVVCNHFQKVPGLFVHSPRLPRMKTDATSSLIPARTADALEVLLREIRVVCSRDARDDVN